MIFSALHILMVYIILSIRVTSLDDVDMVYFWIQIWRMEPDLLIGISFADLPSVVASGESSFSTNPSFSDGFKWNSEYLRGCPSLERIPSFLLIEHTRKSLERKGSRILWMVSGLWVITMKRYSITLVHNGQRCSLVAYLLDGDNRPSAALKSTPLAPFQKGLPSSTSDIS